MKTLQLDVRAMKMSDVLENLKTRIESSGMSYRELASKTGISAAAVCRYVNSKQIPNAYTLLALADALNCTPNDLYGIEKEESFNVAYEKGWRAGYLRAMVEMSDIAVEKSVTLVKTPRKKENERDDN